MRVRLFRRPINKRVRLSVARRRRRALMNWPLAQHCKSRGLTSSTARARGRGEETRWPRVEGSAGKRRAQQRNRTATADVGSPGLGRVVADDVTPALGFYCPGGNQYVRRRRVNTSSRINSAESKTASVEHAEGRTDSAAFGDVHPRGVPRARGLQRTAAMVLFCPGFQQSGRKRRRIWPTRRRPARRKAASAASFFPYPTRHHALRRTAALLPEERKTIERRPDIVGVGVVSTRKNFMDC